MMRPVSPSLYYATVETDASKNTMLLWLLTLRLEALHVIRFWFSLRGTAAEARLRHYEDTNTEQKALAYVDRVLRCFNVCIDLNIVISTST
jgi:hypothetical protein